MSSWHLAWQLLPSVYEGERIVKRLINGVNVKMTSLNVLLNPQTNDDQFSVFRGGKKP